MVAVDMVPVAVGATGGTIPRIVGDALLAASRSWHAPHVDKHGRG